MKKLMASLGFMILFLNIAGVAMGYLVIQDDATGGDCTNIGGWDVATKTCTLTTDLYIADGTALFIYSDNITVNGNGHTLIGGSPQAWFMTVIRYRSGITVKNLNAQGFSTGFYISYSNNINITGNRVSCNEIPWGQGITADESESITISDNFIKDCNTGIMLFKSNNNEVIGNTVSGNSVVGIIVTQSNYNTFRYNTLLNTIWEGMRLDRYSLGNVIYNNNFINTGGFHLIDNGGSNINLSAPIGGNYWSNYDSPEEGCTDLNNDGFCDLPYILSYGQGTIDYLPWTKQNGWLTPEQLLKNLIGNIGNLLNSGGITNAGMANSLTAMLQNALKAIEQGNVQTAENILQAFINHVAAQSGIKITEETALESGNAARQIIGTLK